MHVEPKQPRATVNRFLGTDWQPLTHKQTDWQPPTDKHWLTNIGWTLVSTREQFRLRFSAYSACSNGISLSTPSACPSFILSFSSRLQISLSHIWHLSFLRARMWIISMCSSIPHNIIIVIIIIMCSPAAIHSPWPLSRCISRPHVRVSRRGQFGLTRRCKQTAHLELRVSEYLRLSSYSRVPVSHQSAYHSIIYRHFRAPQRVPRQCLWRAICLCCPGGLFINWTDTSYDVMCRRSGRSHTLVSIYKEYLTGDINNINDLLPLCH